LAIQVVGLSHVDDCGAPIYGIARPGRRIRSVYKRPIGNVHPGVRPIAAAVGGFDRSYARIDVAKVVGLEQVGDRG
jgi:hypothetical protein